MKQDSPHETVVRRAALPELMFAPDIALALLVSEEQAQHFLERECCGPTLRVMGRPAVRHADFLAALDTAAERNAELLTLEANDAG